MSNKTFRFDPEPDGPASIESRKRLRSVANKAHDLLLKNKPVKSTRITRDFVRGLVAWAYDRGFEDGVAADLDGLRMDLISIIDNRLKQAIREAKSDAE